jgi:regulator of CtrA degradation
MNGLATTTFFSRTYDEALTLVVEARDYIAGNYGEERDRAHTFAQLTFDCEALRLTTRLTQVMAWLLHQRAIHEGEVPPESVRDAGNQLSGQAVCLHQEFEMLATLPAALRSLMERSLHLYERVARLDSMVRRDLN